MRGRLRALALVIVLLQGCGGPSPAAGFINQTQHTDAELWALGHAAQQSLSQQIDINPLQRTQEQRPGKNPTGRSPGVEYVATAAYGCVAAGCFFGSAPGCDWDEPA